MPPSAVKERAAPAIAGNGSQKDRLGSAINQTDKPKPWREQYAVHPAADVFPMMSDDELAKLGEDIKANGLKNPILFVPVGGILGADLMVVDGRNRLEAMHRAGVEPDDFDDFATVTDEDIVARVFSQNILRRHLSKTERADAIVKMAKMKGETKTGPRWPSF